MSEISTPMTVNSDRNILKNIASWANQGVTITAMPGGAFVDDAGNLSGICVTGFPDTPAPDEQDATLVKLIDLLTRTANAVKGQPGEMKQHGWADLPELCTALSARVAGLEAALRMFLEAGLGNSTDVVQQRAAVFNAAKLLTAPTHTAPGGEGGGK